MAQAKQLMVYPANRLEDLAVLLNHVLKLGQKDSAGSVLTGAQIVVENTGMQHWLNTQLASCNGIAMNLEYPLPGKFVWQLARQLLGEHAVPQQPPYQREALVWRIDDLLGSAAIGANPKFVDACRYWQAQDQPDLLKRFQLASALADLFEQYILYRPDWLTHWQQGGHIEDGSSVAAAGLEAWQAELWAILCKQDGRHPIDIQQKLITALHQSSAQTALPSQICLFALNTMAPATLEVFSALAHYIPVHVFHLNPCAEYWGHIQSEKAIAAAYLNRWMAQQDDQVLVDGGNPLLANLGSQGKEFFRLLQDQSSFSIDAFEDAQPQPATEQLSLLAQIQQDILRLHDAREPNQGLTRIDDSLVFTSSSTALRELQGLHDWLLDKFQQDPSLKPSDVLVMCPQVEDYAPYVGAVFDTQHRHFGAGPETTADTAPQLPCSIADRKPQDAEPLVAAYLQLLQLPGSRFHVSAVLDLLRLPAMQRKFGIDPSELDTIGSWLSNASVHWGLDAAHKTKVLGAEAHTATGRYTWAWGLKRLLLGFAQGPEQPQFQDDWLLADVEGGQAVLLGRLILVLELLQSHARALDKGRTGEQWRDYLMQMIDEFFTADQTDLGAKDCLATAIGNMAMWIEQVGYNALIGLDVVRYSLTQKLSVASSSQGFITGQVTFCSMVPMRSIPFKVVAMLGLNDGQYPRQSTPLDFDLMAHKERRVGDRSRRGDDRYLFLEALISARSCLYLSYQGADGKNNSPRQPSLMLSELMDYLTHGYGWNFDAQKPNNQLIKLPLHSFSPDNFVVANEMDSLTPKLTSYEAPWLRLLEATSNPEDSQLPGQGNGKGQEKGQEQEQELKTLSIADLVQFLDNPSRTFCQRSLGLYLHEYNDDLSDVEPFSASKLVEYKMRDQLLQAALTNDDDATQNVIDQYSLNGKLPENHTAQHILSQSQDEAQSLAQSLQTHGYHRLEKTWVRVPVAGIIIEDYLPLVMGQNADETARVEVLMGRPTKAKVKDRLTLWITSLVAQVHFDEQVSGTSVHQGKNLSLTGLEEALQQLTTIATQYHHGLTQALALDADCGYGIAKLMAKASDEGAALSLWQKQWRSHKYSKSFDFSNDPYRRWLWAQTPDYHQWQRDLTHLYSPMVAAITEVKDA